MSGFHFGSSHFQPVEIQRSAGRPRVPFARVSPLAKSGLLLLVILGTVAAPLSFWYWHVGVVVALGAIAGVARLSFRSLLVRLFILAPFVAGVAVAAAFHPGGGPNAATLAVRGLLCIASVSIFAAVTPLSELPALLRRLKVPSLLVTTLALMHRYLQVLTAESERMRRARASRTLTQSPQATWFLSADVIGRLFVRASERAERIYLAMCARGWK